MVKTIPIIIPQHSSNNVLPSVIQWFCNYWIWSVLQVISCDENAAADEVNIEEVPKTTRLLLYLMMLKCVASQLSAVANEVNVVNITFPGRFMLLHEDYVQIGYHYPLREVIKKNIATGETSPAITPYHTYHISISTSLTFITSKLPSQDDFHHLMTFITW